MLSRLINPTINEVQATVRSVTAREDQLLDPMVLAGAVALLEYLNMALRLPPQALTPLFAFH